MANPGANPVIRPRPAPSLSAHANSPRSPRTPVPLLARSVSSQFGSPGSFRAEQEDVLVYELNARYFSAGYAGESQPRCIIPFTPDGARRVGDYRQYDADYMHSIRKFALDRPWAEGYELFQIDLHDQDLGLVEDKLHRAMRTIHVGYLQLDQKPDRKAVLVVPSLLPTPLIEITLKVLFSHSSQPPSVALLTDSVMCCVSAGLRHALVIDVAWEETTVTAVGEYKEVLQRRSIRAGKLLTQGMKSMIEGDLQKQDLGDELQTRMTFSEAEDLTSRMGWCHQRGETTETSQKPNIVTLPVPGS